MQCTENIGFPSMIRTILLLLHFITVATAGLESSVGSADQLHARGLEKRDRVWNNQIRCIGPMFAGITEEMTGGPTRFTTPRKFCAAENYGGLSGYNMGGYCDRFHGIEMVVFEKFPDPRNGFPPMEDPSSSRLPQRRFYDKSLTFCALRCRCVRIQNPPDQSRRWPAREILDSEALGGDPAYDLNPVSFPLDNPGPFGYHSLHVLKVALGSEATYQRLGIRVWTIVSRTDHQAPVCLNMLPSYYPAPFDSRSFGVAQHLCASVFHGGSRRGNAGAVCHLIPSSTPGGTPHFQLKLLDYLAHPSFLASNGQLGLSINIWCRSICSCGSTKPEKQKESVPIILNGNADLMATFKDGKVYVKNKDGTDPILGGPTILGAPQPGKSSKGKSSRTCSVLGDDICLDAEQQDPDSQCRLGSCNGAGQCGSLDCRCIARPSLSLMQRAGYGPGLPRRSALCMGSVVLGAAAVTMKGTASRLSGRGLSSAVACPCNQTYVSGACCDADENGLVWEDPSMKLGSLDDGRGLEI